MKKAGLRVECKKAGIVPITDKGEERQVCRDADSHSKLTQIPKISLQVGFLYTFQFRY